MPSPTIISAAADLSAFLSSIPPASTLYLDLEGNRLSRHGSLSIISILIHPKGIVGLIDVLVLGNLAFTAASDDGKTLKSILEDPKIPKGVWDVRNDADALWALHHVNLAGVTDIQLLENASRTGDKKYVCGLEKAIQLDLKLGFMKLHHWIRTKKDIQNLMTSDVFVTRPIDLKTAQYCMNDVIYLPDLHAFYMERIKGEWFNKAMEESMRRVADAHSPGYEPQSPTKKLGPWGSGTEKRIMTIDEVHENWYGEILEDQDEQVDYYDSYEDDGGGTNAADGATCPEALDSCWDNSV